MWLAMIYITTIRKLWKSVDCASCSSDCKPTEPKDEDVFRTCEATESNSKHGLFKVLKEGLSK